jgi:hypothetical protein
VHHPGREGQALTGEKGVDLIAYPCSERAFQHGEAFGLAGMEVGSQAGFAGLDPTVEAEELASGLTGGRQEGDVLAGHQIVDGLSCVCHLYVPPILLC